MSELQVENIKNIQLNSEFDDSENDLLSSKNNYEKSVVESEKNKIYCTGEVCELKIIQQKGFNVKTSNQHNESKKIFIFYKNKQELICFFIRALIFLVGVSLILFVMSKILFRQKMQNNIN